MSIPRDPLLSGISFSVANRPCAAVCAPLLAWRHHGPTTVDELSVEVAHEVAAARTSLQPDRCLVVDATGTQTFADNAEAIIFDSVATVRGDILIFDRTPQHRHDVGSPLADLGKLRGPSQTKHECAYGDFGTCVLIQFKDARRSSIDFPLLVETTSKAFTDYLRELLLGCHRPWPQGGCERMRSIPLHSTGCFDSRILQQHPLAFAFCCLQLARSLYDDIASTPIVSSSEGTAPIREQRIAEWRLLATSTRAAPIAMAIRHLLPDFTASLLIDPNDRRSNLLRTNPADSSRETIGYVFVTDFVIAGGELRFSQGLVHGLNGALLRIAAFGTLLDGRSYGTTPLTRLISLSSTRDQLGALALRPNDPLDDDQ